MFANRGDIPSIWKRALRASVLCIEQGKEYVEAAEQDDWPHFNLIPADYNETAYASSYRFEHFTAEDLASNVMYMLEQAALVDFTADDLDQFFHYKRKEMRA